MCIRDSIHTADNYQDMSRLLTKGFVKAAWCGKEECEIKIKDETGADIRVILFDASTDDNCIYCNNKGRYIAYFARAY